MTSALRWSASWRAAQMARLVLETKAMIPKSSICKHLQTGQASRIVSTAWLGQHRRFYSTQPPNRPDEEEGKAKKDAVEGEGEDKNHEASEAKQPGDQSAEIKQAPLPPGWVHLNAEELATIERIIKDLSPHQQKGVRPAIEVVQAVGCPEEFRSLIHKHNSVGLGALDTMKLLRLAYDLGKRVHQWRGEQRVRGGGQDEQAPDFQSKAPGSPHQKANKDQWTAWSEHQPQHGDKSSVTPGQERPPLNRDHKTKSGGEDGNKDKNNINNNNNGSDWTNWVITAGILYGCYAFFGPTASSREITWQEMRKNFLDKGLVEKFVVQGNRVRVELNREATQNRYPDSAGANPLSNYYFSIGSVETFERHLDEAQEELGIPPSERIPVSYSSSDGGLATNLLLAFGPPVLFVGLLLWMSRRQMGGGGAGGGMFGFGKSKAKRFNHETAVKVKFDDVAGMEEAKVEIMEFVSFLKAPERFQKLGAKIPRGAILSGPPGTGKTLLAKATAGESGVPFFSVSGSEFVEMFVGVGASRVRDLFNSARRSAPCIIFIDEIDAIGKKRSDHKFGGGNDEREATLNQILTEMDGFNTHEQVVVLAGTNRADTLDSALMRPGRFDRHIYIDRPTMKGRGEIFQIYLNKIVTKENIDYLKGRLAALTPGFAGADIANAVNEAALIAARANATTVEMQHFEQAIERVIGGLERKSLVLTPDEKKTVAYHEAGHAICGWFFQWADPLLKVSIIPRGKGALGYAQYLPGDAYLMSQNQLMDRMAMTLGGRVSEELHFPTVTTGASDDFRKVSRMATLMVTEWGMSEKIGPMSFENNPSQQMQKPFAESTAQAIDAEVSRIVDQAYRQCKDLLTVKKDEIGLVAEELLRKEVLVRDDLVRLLGPRPFADKDEFSMFFDGTRGEAPSPLPAEDQDREPPPPPLPPGLEQPPPAPAMFGRLDVHGAIIDSTPRDTTRK